MIKLQNTILFYFLLTLGASAFAIAPVVDESDNFANFDSGDHQQVTTSSESDNFKPLAHDDNESYFSNTSPKQVNVSKEGGDNTALSNQVRDLQQTLDGLRAQIDHQNEVIENLKKQQLTLYKDLDARIQGGSQAKKTTPLATKIDTSDDAYNIPPAPKNTLSSKDKLNPADEQISYMAAYELINKKEFNKAQLALQEFIQQHPSSGFTPNAEYWLGELFLQQKNYATAIAHFENVVNNYPSSNKSASSLYKLAFSLAENGQFEEAKQKYQEVTQKYPDTDAAKLAANQLKIL